MIRALATSSGSSDWLKAYTIGTCTCVQGQGGGEGRGEGQGDGWVFVSTRGL